MHFFDFFGTYTWSSLLMRKGLLRRGLRRGLRRALRRGAFLLRRDLITVGARPD